MPIIQVQTPPTAQAEPVSLALLNTALRLDLDLASTEPAIVAQLDYLHLLVSAAREKVEAFTGRYFAPQTLAITYELVEDYLLPAGAVAESVTGFFTDLDALNGRVAYLEEYRKGISISRELPWSASAGGALAQTYTVTATIAADVAVPALAKAAILELAGEWYRNPETTIVGAVATPLPVSWRVKLVHLVVTPMGY